MSTLNDVIKPITGNKRTFILMRIAGLDANLAMGLVGVNRGTYNSWFKNEQFSTLYSQITNLIVAHRDEAMQLLRRNNQLEAVLLEGKMLKRIKEEIESGQLSFTKTHLAREVYSKLMSDLDRVPEGIKVQSWNQKILALVSDQPRLEAVNGEFKEIGIIEAEHPQGESSQESE